jgi:hypothetical protein
VTRTLCGFAIVAGAAWAQTIGSIDGPVLGLVFDPAAAAVRTLGGIPGSATLGSSIAGWEGARGATASSYAIVIDRNGKAAIVSATGRTELGDAAKAIVSHQGHSAALISGSPGTAHIFTGMPSAPRLERTIQVPRQRDVLAISDDGEMLLSVARGHRGAEDILFADRSTGPQVLYRAARISAAALIPGAAKTVIAASNGVTLLAPDLGIEPLSEDPSIETVGVSADGAKIALAAATGRVIIHDLRSKTSAALACACAPNAMAPLRGNAVFRLTEPGNGPLWILDADSQEPRISFVALGAGR